MADRTHSDHTPYEPGKFDLAAPEPSKTSWIDGLPHAFTGWGPRTPDPADTKPPGGELHWQGDYDDHAHHVWRFDLRRHKHH